MEKEILYFGKTKDKLVPQRIVKTLRVEKGYTQEDLAAITNLSRMTIMRIEKGASCKVSTLIRILRCFDLNLTLDIKTAKKESIIKV